jgi:hypothetical protein
LIESLNRAGGNPFHQRAARLAAAKLTPAGREKLEQERLARLEKHRDLVDEINARELAKVGIYPQK